MTEGRVIHLTAPELRSPSLALFLLLAQPFHFPAPRCQLSLLPGFLPVQDAAPSSSPL